MPEWLDVAQWYPKLNLAKYAESNKVDDQMLMNCIKTLTLFMTKALETIRNLRKKKTARTELSLQLVIEAIEN